MVMEMDVLLLLMFLYFICIRWLSTILFHRSLWFFIETFDSQLT